MRKNIHWILGGCVIGILATVFVTQQWMAYGQLTERPGNSLDNPADLPRDLSGLSNKIPRIRVVHTTDPSQEGGSMYLQQADPWLGYSWGRSMFLRNFRERDGVYGDTGKIDGVLLADGTSKMMDRSHANSCGLCHSVPYRDAGAGGLTIAKNGGTGRNSPHLFGDGLVEMLGLQMRLMALAIADGNRDGWISMSEAKGKRCIIKNLPTGVPGESVDLDFGSFDDEDGDGYPDLNPVFFPIFVDKNGQRIAYARDLKFPEVAGYTFEVQVFGHGHLYTPVRPPVPTTLRSFTITALDMHPTMQAHDPTTHTSPNRDALALISNAGAQQFISAASRDRGAVRAPTKSGLRGISLDDPDRDGYCEEISEGDLDVMEWYLVNHPAPTRARKTPNVAAGEKLFGQIGCAVCHVPDWHIMPGNPGAADYTQRFAGDRRFFDLQVAWNEQTSRLEGKVNYLANRVKTKQGETWTPKRDAFTVRGLFSDLRYHDMGEEFQQMQFDGSIIRKWRTTPLWGVGHTGPYGHDGASLDLNAVILRHGGEGHASRDQYKKLTDSERDQLLAFLNSLILYQTDQLPCDVNGDGKIDDHFKVQGMNTGMERFNPEWLFRIPVKIEGPVRNIRDQKIVSFAGTNIRRAYGLDLGFLRDTDGDGFPDVIDPEPTIRGFKNGIR